MLDGSPPDEDTPGDWAKHERVDEQYREPEVKPFDVEPEVPSPSDPTGNDVDPGLARRFWALVFVFNVALLALSLGAMFVVFEGAYSLGGQLLLAGGAAFGFGLYRYWTTRENVLGERED